MKKALFFGLLILAVLLAIVLGMINSKDNVKLRGNNNKNTVAVIFVQGAITGGGDTVMGSSASASDIMQNLRDAATDPATAAIMLRINSPGGSSAASQEIGEEILRIRSEKKIPVITSMGDVAASGGYWIACCTDRIVANPASMTGSIGVIMETQSWAELYKKVGIKNKSITSGTHKDMGSTSRELTQEEEKLLQAMVNDIYEQFVSVVSSGRNLTPEKVRKIADGRVFTGRQAKELGLVDEMGNYYDALDVAQKAAGIQGKLNIKEYGTSSPLDIFKVQTQISPDQVTFISILSKLLQSKEVQY